MGVMMLAAAKGSMVEIDATGEDETQAIDALSALINDYFGEGGWYPLMSLSNIISHKFMYHEFIATI